MKQLYGFMAGRFCLTAKDNIIYLLDRGEVVDLCFLVLCKTFNVVNNSI